MKIVSKILIVAACVVVGIGAYYAWDVYSVLRMAHFAGAQSSDGSDVNSSTGHRRMEGNGWSVAPQGYIQFCRTNPGEC